MRLARSNLAIWLMPARRKKWLRRSAFMRVVSKLHNPGMTR
jgi:hypothetical protein